MQIRTPINSDSSQPSAGRERSVAIIGAGAAGLSVAHYLKQKGYRKAGLATAPLEPLAPQILATSSPTKLK